MALKKKGELLDERKLLGRLFVKAELTKDPESEAVSDVCKKLNQGMEPHRTKYIFQCIHALLNEEDFNPNVPEYKPILKFLIFCRDHKGKDNSSKPLPNRAYPDSQLGAAIKRLEALIHTDKIESNAKEERQRLKKTNNDQSNKNINGTKQYETAGKAEHTLSSIPQVYGSDKWLNPYNLDSIPFVGRENEIHRLNDFAKHKDKFKIWAITGPSGAGKTRLTIQWAKKNLEPNGWHCHVLQQEDAESPENWLNWSPKNHTLLIIDYIFGFDEVCQAIRKRCEISLKYKVRLLILDHIVSIPLQGDKRWGFSGSGTSFDFKASIFFENKPISLDDSNDKYVLQKIIAYRAGHDCSEKEIVDARKYLSKLPGAQHPLFAALIGDCLKDKRTFSKWNELDLVKYYLSNDRLPWKREFKLKPHNDNNVLASSIIALATMFRGIRINDLTGIEVYRKLSLSDDFRDVLAICNKTISSDDSKILKPFEPDLLGENYFLIFLNDLYFNKKMHSIFFELLLSFLREGGENHAKQYVAFIIRLTSNLKNDYRSMEQTKELWNSLISFLNPDVAPDQPLFRWCIYVGLIEVANALKDERPKKEIRALIDGADIIVSNYLYCEYLASISKYYAAIYEKILLSLSDKAQLKKSYRYTSTPLTSSGKAFYSFDQLMLILAKIDRDFSLQTTFSYSLEYSNIAYAAWKELPNLYASSPDKIVRFLIKHGADINAINDKGWSPLMIACENGYYDIVRSLLKHGANLNAENNYGWTPLSITCRSGHVPIIKLLLELDADLSHKTIDGWTPLMIASKAGHPEVVKLLLKYSH